MSQTNYTPVLFGHVPAGYYADRYKESVSKFESEPDRYLGPALAELCGRLKGHLDGCLEYADKLEDKIGELEQQLKTTLEELTQRERELTELSELD